MNGLKGINAVQKQATLREYAQAVRHGNRLLADRIKNANGKWITTKEFKEAEL
jgi:hypothetical protein